MSGPPFTPENAAPAALVSPASPCRAAESVALASPTHLPRDGPDDPARADGTDAPPPPYPAGPQDTPHVPGQPVALGQQGPPTSHPAPQAAPSSGDELKYHRPAVFTRPHGPSLLTQALATARGIPPPTQAELALHIKNQPTVPFQDTPDPQQFPSRDVDQKDPPNASSPHSDGDSLTPRGSPGAALAMPSIAVATAVAYPHGPVPTSPTKSYNMLDLGEVNSMLNGHRDFLSKSKDRGTSLERIERERRAQDRPSRLGAFSHISASSNALVTPPFAESPSATHPDEAALPETSSDPRARKLDHRLSMAPEKAWSISTGEVAGQDGQVEKSITEAIVGVEPNARASRKASHSLRFFKEGNPDDKGKRRESRLGAHPREKLPPTAEALDAEGAPRGGEGASSRPLPPAEDRPPVSEKLARARSIPARTPEIYPISASPEEYTSTKGGKVHAQADEAQEPLPSPALVGPGRQVSDSVETVLDSALETERKFDASAGVCEVAEEGEESGEEKISSAVFLPHQGLEQSEEESPLPGVLPRSVPSSRTLSRADDFHPWLVKACEPEVDDDKAERPDYERKLRSEPADTPIVAPEVDSSQVEGSAIADENETGARPPRPSRPVSQYQEDIVHDHQWAPKQPLEAIELIPYKHQVGGHTTLWRFSRRAVCKQLNNRENEFYEKVEKHHRDLLAFLPRYIGVLNVTFQKKQRRKSTIKRENAATSEPGRADRLESPAGLKANGTLGDEDTRSAHDAPASAVPERVISQSLHAPQDSVPTVTFVNNQHILPRNLLQPSLNGSSIAGRFRSLSASVHEAGTNGHTTPDTGGEGPPVRPSLQEHQANSWGATTVNKKLRNEVFNDAFLKQPVAVRRHRKGHQRPVPRRTLQQVLRPTGSDSILAVSRDKDAQASARVVEQQAIPQSVSRPVQTQSDIGPGSGQSEDDELAPKDVTGTSAPEPETLADSSPAQKKKRRYSGTGLRRKPKDVRDARGDLKYFEEADDVGYKSRKAGAAGGSREEPADRPRTPQDGGIPEYQAPQLPEVVALSTVPSSSASELPSPTAEFKRIPRPVNPKEAQTQRDSRVEYFLLLEDLTAGMKRPCIMDLKMGTRQYGVDANAKKQKSQQGKCAKTTSRELGVRVCGLQVWDVKTQSYVFKDKYYGRDLQIGQEFQDALTRFLYDGVDRGSILRHIPTVLQKLDQLEVIIGRLRGYRFYAASLLMFYDGEPAPEPGENGNGNGVPHHHQSHGPHHPSPLHQRHGNYNYDTAIEDSTTDFATDTEEAATAAAVAARRTRRSRREIDFKMADFANCVAAGDDVRDRPCPPRHPNEPDRGFLRGLRSLRRYFLKIQRDTRAEMGLAMAGKGRNGGVNGGEWERDWEREDLEDERSVSE